MAPTVWRLVAAAMVLLTFTACGRHDAVPPPAKSPDDFPLVISHRYGGTYLPSPPARVVTLGWNDQDIVQALGVKPVGVRSMLPKYPTYPWVDGTVSDPPIVSGQEIDFDAVTAAKPDVILATGADIDQPTYDRLSKIAPTVVSEERLDKADTPWYAQTFVIAQALGKADEGRRISTDVGARYNQVRAAHPYWVNRTAVVDWLPEGGGHYLLPMRDTRRSVLDGLGFLTERFMGPISNAEMPTKGDGDLLVVVGATAKQAASMGGFATLRPVIERRAIYIPSDSPLVDALELGGPEARIYALEQLTPQLEAALPKPVPKS